MCLDWPGYGSCLEGYSNQVIQATLCRPGIDFIDAYNAVHMRKQGLTRIYSYDSDFDRIAVVSRVEP